MSHQQKPALRVEFTEPAVQHRTDFDDAITSIAQQAGISAQECFEVTRFKTKKPKMGSKIVGTAEIVIRKGCPQTFLALFQGCHAFTSAELAAAHH